MISAAQGNPQPAAAGLSLADCEFLVLEAPNVGFVQFLQGCKLRLEKKVQTGGKNLDPFCKTVLSGIQGHNIRAYTHAYSHTRTHVRAHTLSPLVKDWLKWALIPLGGRLPLKKINPIYKGLACSCNSPLRPPDLRSSERRCPEPWQRSVSMTTLPLVTTEPW